MAYQKLQVRDGLDVIPSATIPIPDPSTEVLSGTADFSVAGTLTDVGTTFLSAGIQNNAIVYNTTANVAYFVTAVTDNLNLALSPSSAGGATDNYVIYNASTEGCILYVGGTGNLTAVMATDKDVAAASQKELTFQNLPDASFLPIQVCRVDDTTTATNIIALF